MENFNKTSNSIKNWAADDRPREKLFTKGAHTLSDSELIAILISNGYKVITRGGRPNLERHYFSGGKRHATASINDGGE